MAAVLLFRLVKFCCYVVQVMVFGCLIVAFAALLVVVVVALLLLLRVIQVLLSLSRN